MQSRGCCWGCGLILAEADGNRTRRGTLAPPLVLKTREPTRRSFASSGQQPSLTNAFWNSVESRYSNHSVD